MHKVFQGKVLDRPILDIFATCRTCVLWFGLVLGQYSTLLHCKVFHRITHPVVHIDGHRDVIWVFSFVSSQCCGKPFLYTGLTEGVSAFRQATKALVRFYARWCKWGTYMHGIHERPAQISHEIASSSSWMSWRSLLVCIEYSKEYRRASTVFPLVFEASSSDFFSWRTRAYSFCCIASSSCAVSYCSQTSMSYSLAEQQ